MSGNSGRQGSNLFQDQGPMISVFDYLDYRSYLHDLLKEQKRINGDLTQKLILHRLGISSTGFLSNIIAGRKNLTHIQTVNFSKIVKHTKTEASYFEVLVYFTQSRTLEEKNEYLSRLTTLQKINMKAIDGKRLSLFAKPYYVFIRELLSWYEFRGDFAALGRMLDPPIKGSAAKEAIEHLECMGLIKRDATGVYGQTDAALTTGDEVQSVHLAHFQFETLDMAKRAIETVPAEERDVSVLTLTLSSDAFRLVKSEMQNFRKRIAKIAVEDPESDRVYQMNLQLFPVSKRGRSES